MTMNMLGEIRRSQVITTYGPGAIVDFRAGTGGDAAISVVAAGLEAWERAPAEIIEATKIYEPRLMKLLRVQHFRLAPVAPKDPPSAATKQAPRVYLEGRRFPQWQQCPRCHTIGPAPHWRSHPGDPSLTCPSHHNEQVPCVPVRFVTTCRNGHLDEFPWSWWVHGDAQCSNPRFTLDSEGGTGLAALVLKCAGCGKQRTMDNALSKGSFQGRRCRGKRPWLDDQEDCNEPPIAVQRGASNLYFSRSFSSLDIPPWSDPIMKTLGANWQVIAGAAADVRPVLLQALDAVHKYTTRLGMTAEQILDTIATRSRILEESDPDSLRHEEHQRLLEPTPPAGSGHEFETRVHPLPERLRPFVESLVEVRKLREVRAITGFTRVSPPGPDDGGGQGTIAPLARKDLDWLPAVEIRGEGIFLELDKKRITAWQAAHNQELQKLIHSMQHRHERAWADAGREGAPPEHPLNPTYLLVHTLAHALIRQLSLDCGYSSASLRERLYVEVEDYQMAGLLIYTGSSDADGTLGGLSRQAHPKRLEEFFVEGIRNLAWCANDPLCIHGEASSEPLNRAACHSCALVAETSCETFNLLLDRSVLVGTPENRKLGFFAELLSGG